MKEINSWYHPNTLNVYRFGSHVYGTNNENSDEDFYVIQEEYTESESVDIHHITRKEFQQLLDENDIQALECFFAQRKDVLKETVKFDFNLDLSKLRKSISTISDGSWQKGKKKLKVAADYDKHIALKSIFHSLRIRDIGIQVATHGTIISFSRMNYILEDLYSLGDDYERTELWEKIDAKYRSVYNDLRSKFVALCPKDNKVTNKILTIREILKENGETLPESVIKEIANRI